MSCTTYRHLAIDGAGPPPTEAQIRAIEDELGARLPPGFRDYLRVANGGTLEYSIDDPAVADGFDALSFPGLFSADAGDFCDETFVGEIRSNRAHARIPIGMLPFARSGGGSVVYLDLSPAGGGRVIAFVMGVPDWPGQRAESAFVELAASFDAYVDKLRLDVEAALDHLNHDVTTLADVADIEQRLDIGLPTWRSEPRLAEAARAARLRLSGQA